MTPLLFLFASAPFSSFRLIVVDHTYSHFHVTLNVHHCKHLSGDPQAIECDEIRWVELADLDSYPFPKANLQIIAALRQWRDIPCELGKDPVN